jgi:hypothetical protein
MRRHRGGASVCFVSPKFEERDEAINTHRQDLRTDGSGCGCHGVAAFSGQKKKKKMEHNIMCETD